MRQPLINLSPLPPKNLYHKASFPPTMGSCASKLVTLEDEAQQGSVAYGGSRSSALESQPNQGNGSSLSLSLSGTNDLVLESCLITRRLFKEKSSVFLSKRKPCLCHSLKIANCVILDSMVLDDLIRLLRSNMFVAKLQYIHLASAAWTRWTRDEQMSERLFQTEAVCELMKALSENPNLTSLQEFNFSTAFSTSMPLSSYVQAILKRNPHLKRISISSCAREEHSRMVQGIAQGLQSAQSSTLQESIALQELSLSKCAMDNRQLQQLVEALNKQCTSSLRRLDLSSNTQVTMEALPELVALLDAQTNLEFLNLDGMIRLFEFTQELLASSTWKEAARPFVTSFLDALAQNTHLRELHLASCGITDEVAKEIWNVLTSNTSLSFLSLSNNKCSPLRSSLAQYLPHIHHLQTLRILHFGDSISSWSSQNTAAGSRLDFYRGLARNMSLEVLHFQHVPISSFDHPTLGNEDQGGEQYDVQGVLSLLGSEEEQYLNEKNLKRRILQRNRYIRQAQDHHKKWLLARATTINYTSGGEGQGNTASYVSLALLPPLIMGWLAPQSFWVMIKDRMNGLNGDSSLNGGNESARPTGLSVEAPELNALLAPKKPLGHSAVYFILTRLWVEELAGLKIQTLKDDHDGPRAKSRTNQWPLL